MTRIRQLFELGQGDTESVGAKAANLGALASHGLPVPPGVVVVATETDDGIEAAVAEALAVLGDGPLAVRSSALAEDLDGASFAGQYETVLDVRGAEAVVEAVRRVRAPCARMNRWKVERCCIRVVFGWKMTEVRQQPKAKSSLTLNTSA